MVRILDGTGLLIMSMVSAQMDATIKELFVQRNVLKIVASYLNAGEISYIFCVQLST